MRPADLGVVNAAPRKFHSAANQLGAKVAVRLQRTLAIVLRKRQGQDADPTDPVAVDCFPKGFECDRHEMLVEPVDVTFALL